MSSLRALVVVALVCLTAAACLDPLKPAVMPECRRPVADTSSWQRVGSSAISMRVPATFAPIGANEWGLDPTRVSLRTTSNQTNTGQPLEMELISSCRAQIAGRTAVIEIAQRGGDVQKQHFVIATWPRVRAGCDVVNVVYRGSTPNDSDIFMLLAIAWTMQIVESTGPGLCMRGT